MATTIELIEKTCNYCNGTGDWSYEGQGPAPLSCEVCDGTGKRVDVPEMDLDRCVLTDEDVNVLAKLWHHPHKNCNLGEFIRRVAVMAQRRLLEKQGNQVVQK